jgi:tripartite-type tricarboxylate transporter receptor subunit TctC
MKRMTTLRGFGVLIFIFAFWPTGAFGQGEPFPVKPVNMYVGYPPGGFTAISGQITAEAMKKYLNQPVVLNFKPGAVQAIATEFVKTSKPDGYTLLYLAQGNLTAKITKDKQEGVPLKFQIDDLEALGAGPYSPYTVAVNADSPWKTMEDFISAARKSPGSLNFGSDGIGASAHLLMEFFSQKAGISLNHIPFQGGGPAVTALLGGHVQIIAFSVTTLGAQVKPGGGLRPLLVFDKKRDLFLPDVPTALEKGYDIALSSWQGLRAPKGLPKPVSAILIDAFQKTMKDPQIIQSMAKFDCSVTYFSPEEMEKKNQEEYKLYLDVWEKIGKK